MLYEQQIMYSIVSKDRKWILKGSTNRCAFVEIEKQTNRRVRLYNGCKVAQNALQGNFYSWMGSAMRKIGLKYDDIEVVEVAVIVQET